jgi:energy-coupling factor transport system ATP-binding protein
MLFQSSEAQLFERTVFADVAFGPRQLGIRQREVRARVVRALDAVGLPARDYGARSPFELSGGQMRRVALAGVLALDPPLLVLDEPTLGLDASGRAEFVACLGRLRRDRDVTVILVSHDMREVAALADRVLVLHEGRLVADGTPHDVLTRGADLAAWGLAPPPVVELVDRLRQGGLAIPPGILTVDEAADVLRCRLALGQ